MGAKQTRGALLPKIDGGTKRASVKRIAIQKKTKPEARKLKLVEHSPDKKTKILIRNNIVRAVAKPPTSTLAKPPQTTLAVPSPYRFPLPRTQSLALVARIAGLSFIVTGAFFSWFTSGAHERMVAYIEGSTQRAATVEGTANQETQALSEVQAPPAISISVPGSAPFLEVMPITITAAADRVDVYARRAGSSNTKLGSATNTDTPSVWQFKWDTRPYEDGEYTLSAVAFVGNNSYTETLATPVTLQDVAAPAGESQQTVTGTGDGAQESASNASSTTATANEGSAVKLSVPQSNLKRTVSLTVRVTGATQVRVSAYNQSTGALYHAGTAEKAGDDEWKIAWDTTKVVDGRYRLVADATVNGTSIQSSGVSVSVENGIKATVNTTASTTAEKPSSTPAEVPTPDISLSFVGQSPFHDAVSMMVWTTGANAVELYRQSVQSLAPFFLGKAVRTSDTAWSFTWNTHETPNGEYYIFARVVSPYGIVDGGKMRTEVRNVILETFTDDQTSAIDTLANTTNALVRPTDTAPQDATSTPNEEQTEIYIETADSFIKSIETDDADARAALADILSDYRAQLDSELNALARALRTGDAAQIDAVRARIEALKEDIIARIPESPDKALILDRTRGYLDRVAHELDELTIKNDKVIKERIGDAITKDSDKDGISDYDEVNLYQTNPFTADTDGDGFIDSVEITQGFNPLNTQSEALISYESPQESGVVREDLLAVASVSTLSFAREDGEERNALFTGTALPNSFVTLYIYSTPIIVTVKTDSDGNWNYMLDKDLEDGEHEVYVGITDNTGRIVAKSNPLPFVKTAEAYSGITAPLPTTDSESVPSFLGGNTLLFAGSLLIVLLGLVLLLLGMHAHSKEHVFQPVAA